MVHVLAIITTKPGMRDAVLAAFHANAAIVRAEVGCIEYGAAVDVANAPPNQTPYGADTFVVIEKWTSLDTLKAHGATPHMAAYREKTAAMMASRAIHILSPA